MASRHIIVRQLRHTPVVAALALAAACSRKDAAPAVDSSLARDLSMAGQTVPDFTPADTALNPNAKVRVTPKAPTVKASTPKPAATPRPATPTRIANAPRPAAETPTAAPTVVSPAPTPAPAASSTGSSGNGLAGTSLAMVTGSKVCTTNLVGDKLVAKVNQTSGPGAGTIPAGSTVVLEVADMEIDDAHPELSKIVFRVRAISAGGVDYPGNGATVAAGGLEKVNTTPASSDAKKAAAGAIAGAILGQVIGHNTKGTVIGAAAGGVAGAVAGRATRKYEGCLPAGTALRVTLNAA